MAQVKNEFVKQAQLREGSIVILSQDLDGLVAKIGSVRADAAAGFVYTLHLAKGTVLEAKEAELCGAQDKRIGTAYKEYKQPLTEKQLRQLRAFAAKLVA